MVLKKHYLNFIYTISLIVLNSCANQYEVRNTITDDILINGVENKIILSGITKPNLYKLKNDSIIIDYNKECNCFPFTPNKNNKKSIILTLTKKSLTVDSIKFHLKQIPSPNLNLLGYSQADATIKIEDLKYLDKIEIEPWLNFNKFEIVSFNLLNIKNGSSKLYVSHSNLLTTEMKEEIILLTKGSRLSLINIKLKMPDDEIRNVNSFNLRVR